MKRKSVYVFICTALIFSLVSCNLPFDGQGNTADLELTITAQALIIEQAAQSPTPTLTPIVIVITATPAEGDTATPQTIASETPSQGNSSAPTSTLSSTGAPTVTVSVATNCRKGPGQAYESVYGLQIGQSAEVVGKNTSTNYWIIKIPGSNNTCWLWGQYATVTGDISSLQTVQIPPTPTSTATKVVVQAPAAPSNLIEQNTCILNPNPGGFTYVTSGTVTWQDNSNNENGFNVYWNAGFGGAVDVLIGTVGPNVTSHGFSNMTYSDMVNSVKVEAFNNTGISNRVSVKVVLNCPPKP